MNGWQKYQGVEHELVKKEAMLLLYRDGSFGQKETSTSEGIIEDWNSVFKETWKTGAEVLKSGDPFEALITLAGKQTIGFSLSKFNYSQLAGLMGLVVTTFAPQVVKSLYSVLVIHFVSQITVPLLLKKITEDLKSLNHSMNIVRTSPHFMATQYYCSALQKCQNDLCQEVTKNKEKCLAKC